MPFKDTRNGSGPELSLKGVQFFEELHSGENSKGSLLIALERGREQKLNEFNDKPPFIASLPEENSLAISVESKV